MNKPGSKCIPKMKVKKSGSLGDDSDRSLSPTDIIDVKENKPVGQRLSNSLVKRTKSGVRAVSSLPVKQTNANLRNAILKQAKSPAPKQTLTKPTPTKKTTLLTTPKSSIKKAASKTMNELQQSQQCLSPAAAKDHLCKSPSGQDSPLWKPASVHIRSVPLASTFISRPLPGRGGPKKPKKLYNPPTLLSICRLAVQGIICEEELNEETKEFVKRRCLTQALMCKLWDTLTKDTKKNRQTIEALVNERDTLSKELCELKESLDQRIASLTSQHRDILTKATGSLTEQYAAEKQELVTSYESAISDLRSQLVKLEDEYEDEKSRIRREHEEEMTVLHQQYKDQIDNTVQCHDREKDRFLDTIAALEQQNDYLEDQLLEKEQSLQSDVDCRVQEKVARYATINAELQSLQDVIDMKNRETKILRNEVFDLTDKIEDITELRRDNMSMRNINEQLEATIAMKTVSERNLSMTEINLREELGLRANESTNLSLKCEELHFKLSAYEEVLGKDHNIMKDALSGIYGSPRHQSTPSSSPIRLPNTIKRGEDESGKAWAKDKTEKFDRPLTASTDKRTESPILNIDQLENFHNKSPRSKSNSEKTSFDLDKDNRDKKERARARSTDSALSPVSYSRSLPGLSKSQVQSRPQSKSTNTNFSCANLIDEKREKSTRSYSDTDLLNNRDIKPTALNALFDEIRSLKKDRSKIPGISPRSKYQRSRSQSESSRKFKRRVSAHFTKTLSQLGLYTDIDEIMERSSTFENMSNSTSSLDKRVSFNELGVLNDDNISMPHKDIDKPSTYKTKLHKVDHKVIAKLLQLQDMKSSETDSSSGPPTPVYLKSKHSKQTANPQQVRSSKEKFFTFTEPDTPEKVKKKLERSKVLSEVKSRSKTFELNGTRLKSNTPAGMVTVNKTSPSFTRSKSERSMLVLKSPDPYKKNLFTYNNDQLVKIPVTPIFLRRKRDKSVF